MFTGFASENTPAIQVWDFATADRSLISISLTDDCAPIQVIVGGATSNTIILYLPPSPIDGKQIKIVNTFYGNFPVPISIRSSDASGLGSSTTVGFLTAGQTLDLCYSKNFISRSVSNTKTGWISLNQAPISASNRNAVSFGDANIASGSTSGTFGGSGNIASGQAAFVAGGASSSANGTNAFASGQSNTVNGDNGSVLGGSSSTASGTRASVVGGQNNTASATNAAVVGGTLNSANQANACVIGGGQGTTRLITGFYVTPASNVPIANIAGNQQLGTLLLGRQTTDATATVLRSDTNAASTTNQVILPNNSAYYVKGSIIATVTGGGNTKSWDFIATIKRGANAAATSIVGAVTLNVQAADAGAATWVVAITADTTNGGLAVTVTGQAATTIRWVAKLESTEVTY
jgi:hypothetical protein